MSFAAGSVAGRYTDEGYFRTIVLIGTITGVFGIMITSICKEYYQFFLVQGAMLGISQGLLFTPAVAVVATWFRRKRALALGIVAVGSSVGGLCFPIMLTKLIPKIGFGWSVRTIGFMVLAFDIIALATMKSRLPPRLPGPIFDFSAFKSAAYNFFVAGMFFGFLAVYTPFYYIEQCAIRDGISPDIAFYLLSVINAASTFGRVIPSYLADKFGAMNIFIPAVLVTAIIIFIWPATYNLASLILFACIFGFSSGVFVSMPPTVLASLSSDMSKVGTQLGMAFLIIGFATLIGTPLTGAIISAQSGSYSGAAGFAGGCLLIGGSCMIIARSKVVGWKFFVKV
ncbi:Riboflavin transporter MCH5 [Neolecta irregularis DAH-3]|uniref:Riboflavin transporter MCH5 n=1 Tax=Neolecta irregularis (strain DAH-3) TaxID=1198029 RepID=A0A1U7LH22_NEOID|nr:Riboflavin transporter MCH5 [Neolecta irregularis DAH-3]|eukprot:OLL21947.1 Riboflavin transporter MCH5 [Neolecta irregularis DAH-3]